MRGLIDSIVLSDGELTALVPADRWREAGANADTPARPFAEYRWGLSQPGVTSRSQVRSQILDVYVHDEEGSYDAVINPAISRLRTVLDAATGSVGFGASLAGAVWQEDSPDIYDDGHRTAVRYSRYRIIGTGI